MKYFSVIFTITGPQSQITSQPILVTLVAKNKEAVREHVRQLGNAPGFSVSVLWIFEGLPE